MPIRPTVPREWNVWYTPADGNEVDGIPRLRPIVSLFCRHKRTAKLNWVDHTDGHGWMADGWSSDICLRCGYVSNIKRTH